jgi:hypothetical protein
VAEWGKTKTSSWIKKRYNKSGPLGLDATTR